MLTHFIISAYKGIIEIGLWIMIIIGAMAGYALGAKVDSGGMGLIIGAVITFFVLAIFFGAALLLADIHSMLQRFGEQQLIRFGPHKTGKAVKKTPSKKELSELGISFDGEFYYVREFRFTEAEDAIDKAKILAVQNGVL